MTLAMRRPETTPVPHSWVRSVVLIGVALCAGLASYGLPAALSGVSGTFGSGTAVLLVAVLSFSYVAYDFELYLYYWLTLALLQNSVATLWIPDGADVGGVLTEVKTVSIICAVIALLPKVVAIIRQSGVSSCFVLYLLVLAINVRGFSQASLAYGRNFTVPLLFALACAAGTDRWSITWRRTVLGRVLIWVVLTLLFGTVVELVVGTQQWRAAVGIGEIGSLSDVSDSTTLFGLSLPRVAGFIIEPTNAGYVAASIVLAGIGLWLSHRSSSTRALLFGAIIGGGALLVLSAAKSGALMILSAIIVFAMIRLFARNNSRLGGAIALIVSWLLSLIVVVVYVVLVKGPSVLPRLISDPTSIVGGDSTTYHLAGLLNGLESLLPPWIGHGLGNGGNFARAETASSVATWMGSGGESSWGVLAYQLGIVGFVAFLGIVIGLARAWGTPSAGMLGAWTSGAMFAEALFGPQAAAVIILAAALLRQQSIEMTRKGRSAEGFDLRPRAAPRS